MAQRNKTIVLLALLALMIASPALSENWTLQQGLTPQGDDYGSEFGGVIGIDGDLVLVSSIADDENGTYSGSAYLFARSDGVWTRQAKLLPDDGEDHDRFGTGGAIEGNTVVVGAGADDNDGHSGSVYVFERSGGIWTQQVKLLPSADSGNAGFGNGIAMDGDTLVIGAHLDTNGGTLESGAAYVYVRDQGTWVLQTKLLPSAGTENSFFGNNLDVDGDTVIVSAALDDENGSNAGVAYVYVRDGATWSMQAKLFPEDLHPESDKFGWDVSIDGDTAIVGSYYDNELGTRSGSAYVFVRTGTTWTQQAELLPDGGGAEDYFGISVSVSDDTAVVVAMGEMMPEEHGGSVHFFTRNGTVWTEDLAITPMDGGEYNTFGDDVDMDDDTVVASFRFPLEEPDNLGLRYGVAYVYTRDGLEGGRECRLDADCASGFCVDGVCCDSSCGGGDPTDCLACSLLGGSAQDGICAELDLSPCDDGDPDTTNDTCHAGECLGEYAGDSGAAQVPPSDGGCGCESARIFASPTLLRTLAALLF